MLHMSYFKLKQTNVFFIQCSFCFQFLTIDGKGRLLLCLQTVMHISTLKGPKVSFFKPLSLPNRPIDTIASVLPIELRN